MKDSPAHPRVSALITSYNYGRYVARAVQSVLDQKYQGEVECIVVDDGSTDETSEVLQEFGDRLRAVRQENAGQAAAFNTAYSLATGDVICLLDADDTWRPAKIARIVRAFEEDPALGLVHHALEIVGSDGNPVTSLDRTFVPANGDVSALMWRKGLPYPFTFSSGVSLRRSVARFIFPLQTNLKSNADGLIATSAALLKPVAYLPEVLGTYYVHGANIWAGDFLRMKEGTLPVLVRAEKYTADLEEKVRQANATLRRAGRRGKFSAWTNWTYLKSRALLDGRLPLAYYPKVIEGVRGLQGIGLLSKISLALRLLRRAAKHSALREPS